MRFSAVRYYRLPRTHAHLYCTAIVPVTIVHPLRFYAAPSPAADIYHCLRSPHRYVVTPLLIYFGSPTAAVRSLRLYALLVGLFTGVTVHRSVSLLHACVLVITTPVAVCVYLRCCCASLLRTAFAVASGGCRRAAAHAAVYRYARFLPVSALRLDVPCWCSSAFVCARRCAPRWPLVIYLCMFFQRGSLFAPLLCVCVLLRSVFAVAPPRFVRFRHAGTLFTCCCTALHTTCLHGAPAAAFLVTTVPYGGAVRWVMPTLGSSVRFLFRLPCCRAAPSVWGRIPATTLWTLWLGVSR